MPKPVYYTLAICQDWTICEELAKGSKLKCRFVAWMFSKLHSDAIVITFTGESHFSEAIRNLRALRDSRKSVKATKDGKDCSA